MVTVSVEGRFWAKVNKSDDCWLWTAGKDSSGYGKLNVGSRADLKQTIISAHRLSWQIHFGEIPEGLLVCHTCDVPACVNPDHLFLGTDQDNTDDMLKKNRGNKAKGSANGSARLDEEIVRCIRKYYPMFTQKQLRLMFTVGKSTMHDIVHHNTWKHVI